MTHSANASLAGLDPDDSNHDGRGNLVPVPMPGRIGGPLAGGRPDPLTRAEMFAWVAQGIAVAGLPTPLTVNVHDHNHVMVRVLSNDTAAAHYWAGYLGLSAPAARGKMQEPAWPGGKPWREYGSDGTADAGRWTVNVWCVVDVDR